MGAVSTGDSQNGPLATVSRIAGTAEFTFSASRVDLSHDSLTHERWVGSFFDDADEFVADGSFETCVASGDFQISITDAGKQHSYERFVARRWLIDISNGQAFLFNSQSFHKNGLGVSPGSAGVSPASHGRIDQIAGETPALPGLTPRLPDFRTSRL